MDTPITLYNAGLFSALAYAPNGVENADSMAWALTQPPSTPAYQDAIVLQKEGWLDITATVLKLFNLPANAFEDGTSNTAFHVFQNSNGQVVFAFRGSTNPVTSLVNWAADLTPTDQGFTSFQGIGPLAQALYTAMTNPGSPYASDTYFADGHSLGGGIAQTFAVLNGINGFAQDPLPISPGGVALIQSKLGMTAISDYRAAHSFQSEVLQGDVANANYAGQTFAYSNVALWLKSSFGATENKLVNALSSSWFSKIPLASAFIDIGLLRAAIGGHNLDTLNAQVAIQVAPDGTIRDAGAPDLPATQTAIHSLIATLTSLPVVKSILGNVEASVQSQLAGASGPTALENDSSDGAIRIGGLGASIDILTGSDTQPDVLVGDSSTDLIIGGAQATTLVAGSGTDYLVTGPASDTIYGGGGSDTFIFDVSQVTGNSTETIDNPSAADTVVVNTSSGDTTLVGGAPVADASKTWEANGVTYTFAGLEGASVGSLTITGGALNSAFSNTIIINNFNLAAAENGGFLGIKLTPVASLNFGATTGIDPPAPEFDAGTTQAYTFSIDTASDKPQTVTVSLGGVAAGDFQASVAGQTVQQSSNGTFSFVLPTGETSVAFSLTNTGDVGGDGNLQLSASLSNPANPSGTPVVSNSLAQSFVEGSLDPFTVPQVAPLFFLGTSSDGVTPFLTDLPTEVPATVGNDPVYIVADDNNEAVAGGSGKDTIDANFGAESTVPGVDQVIGNGGQDVIVNSSNDPSPPDVQIFANRPEDISSAIQNSQTAPQRLTGDLIINEHASNATIVGSNGNDLITAAFENALIIAGSGNDTIVGGLAAIGVPPGSPVPMNLPADNSSLANDWSVTSATPDGVTVSTPDDGISQPIFFVAPVPTPPSVGYEGNIDAYGDEYGSANETIFGGSGASTILLSNGNNYVNLETGNSSVYGGIGENTIIGGSGQQFVLGGGGNDYIAGGTGNSTLIGRGGDNTILGGGGDDTIFAGAPRTSPDSTSWATAETGNNYVDGGSGNDQIFGSGGNDTLIAGDGNSTVFGGAGTELIVGGSGNDLLFGGPGNDTIDAGGAGLDSIQALGSSSSTTLIYGGDGTDSINGGSGSNVIYAGDGGTAAAPTSVFASLNDASATTTIYGGLGVDELVGTAGTAVIYAGDGGTADGATSVFAGSGSTTIYGGLGTDVLQGGSGTDVIYAGDGGSQDAPTQVIAGSGVASLYGGAGTDLLLDAVSGADLIVAGTGNSTVIGTGSDTVVAGTGNDTIQSNGGNLNVQVNDGFGNISVVSNGGNYNLGFDSTVSVSDLTITPFVDAGGELDLLFTGDGGSLEAFGALNGALTGVSFAGSAPLALSQVLAQDGVDTTVAGSNGNLIFSAADGSAVTGGDDAGGLFGLMETDTISAWGSNDTLTAGTSGTLIEAQSANDQVFAGAGNDTLVASGTADTLFGGTGNTTFTVNDPSAVISVQPGQGLDTVLASVNYTLPSSVDNIILTGTAGLTATGNSDVSNTLTGNAGMDTLIAGSGADTLIAGAGLDTLIGGTGGDTYVVNNSADVVMTELDGVDTILSSANYTLPTGADILALTGSANLIATGNDDFRNTITGNAGADTLQAGSGSDTLIGGAGVDTFIGGGSPDVFVINNIADVVQAGSSPSFDTIQSSVNYTLPINVDTLTLTGSANLAATGNGDAANLITSNTGNDSLIAGSGSDSLIALTGLDTLVAGSGPDLLQGSFGDTYVLNAGFGAAHIAQTGSGGTLQFGAGITASGLTLSAQIGSNGTPSLVISSAGSGAATVDGAFGGSIGQYDFADGTSLTLNELLTTAQITPTTIVGANGNLILNGTTAASIVGGQGNDTIYGVGANDTIVAGSGNDVIFAENTGAVLVGGTGSDELSGGPGSDTIVGGAGVTTLNGGSGDDTYVLTQGSVAQIQPGSSAGRELLELPQGMSLADFAGYAVGQDLVIRSTTDDTSAVIQGFFNPTSNKTWFVASDTDAPELLQNFVAALPAIADSSYAAEVTFLGQGYTANLSAELESLGKAGGSLGTLTDIRTAGLPISDYTFNGTSTQNVTVSGGVLAVGSSESGQDQFQTQTSTQTVTVPVFSTVTVPGTTTFYSLQQALQDLPNGVDGVPIGPPGSTVTPIDEQEVVNGVTQDVLAGFDVQSAPTVRTEQTGTTSSQVTTTAGTEVLSRGFTTYNITGDGGNDTITAAGPFVGTVNTGDGNVSVDLGTTSQNGEGDWIGGDLPGTQIPLFSPPSSFSPYAVQPGAFIQAGAGNDTIVGTNGNDLIAAGSGYESLDGGNGADTYVVPLQGYATEIIADSGDPAPDMLELLTGGTRTFLGGSGVSASDPLRFFETEGPGQFPLDTLQLPAGITPQNLKVRDFTDPLDSSKRILELTSGTSTVDVVYAPPPTLPDLRVAFVDNIFQTLTTPASIGVDLFKFADGTTLTRDQLIAQATLLPNDFNPEVAAQTTAVHAGVSIAAAALFSATDASDAAITWYQFSDAGGGGGHFVLNGQVQASNQPFLVNAGQLAQLSYVGGTLGSSDAIQVSAFDGAVWSAATTLNIVPTIADLFQASAANQLVSGVPTGPDTLIGGFGNDTLAGASGDDTFDYTAGAGALTVSDSLSGSNTLAFSAGITPSMLTLGIAADGALQLRVGSGGDVVNIEGFNAQDALNSGVIQNFSFADGTVLSYAQLVSQGFDIVGTTGNQLLTGTNLNNRIVAGTGNDTLIGSGTNDTLVAGSGVDTLIGGNGVETFILDNSSDVVQVGTSNASDTIDSSASYELPNGVETLVLTGSSNLAATGNGDAGNTLVANAGNDTLAAGGAVATLVGGSGNELFVVNNTADIVQPGAAPGNDTLQSSVSNALVAGVDTLVLTGTGNLVGTGNTDASNALVANSGNDTLISGPAVTTLTGGVGNDIFVINNVADVVLGGATPGNDTIQSTVNYSLATGVDTLMFTGGASLAATGNSDAANTLIANSGNDTLTAGSAVATLIGGAGNDTFVINNSLDVVQPGAVHGNDTILSSASTTLAAGVDTLMLNGMANLSATGNADATNVLDANSGNDSLIAGSAVSTLVGGAGNDLFVVNSTSDVVQAGTAHGADTIQSSVSYAAASGVDTLILTGTANLAATGNSDASNVLVANSGNDTLTSGVAVTTLIGGTGNDIFVINNLLDVVQLGATHGNDTILSSVNATLVSGVDTLTLTGAANLSATGNADATNMLSANSGNDTLTSGGAVSTLVGGVGNDVFVVNNSSDVIQAGPIHGADTVQSSVTYILPTGADTLVLTGTANANATGNSDAINVLQGNVGTDVLTAGSGADSLISGTGIDTLVAGTGNDAFLVNNASDVVSAGATHGADTIFSSVNYTLPTNVMALNLTGTAALAATGNTSADVLTGNSGNDTLTAGTGIDTLIGGSGNTTFVVNNANDVVQGSSASALNTLLSSVAYVLPANVNALILTGTAALKGTANSGNDTLTSNTGIDTLVGGAGNDTFVIGNASDVVQDTSSTSANVIQSAVNFTLPTDVNTLVFTGTAALHGTGNSGNDLLMANSGADTLSAGNGNDTLVSSATGSAIDSLVGGTGNDLFIVNSASDIVKVGTSHGVDTIQSSVSYTASANVADLTLLGTANLTATGNALANLIVANSGADTLTSGSGVATLVGGVGNDTFVVNSASDMIEDTSTAAANTLSSSVSYTLPTNVNRLILTGSAALVGTANSGNDTLTAGSGADTLVGGTGTDVFVVNSASDVVRVGVSGTNDSIQSSASYTLPTNVQYLTLTGTSALAGTGNSLTDLIVGNSGNDTLTGGTGIAVLEGGRTAGSDQIKALSNQAALIGGAAASTLTGGAFKDLYAAGAVSDSITTGATANVVSVNKGDGATTLAPTTGATNVLSLGAGIDTESLVFNKSGNNLILSDGVSGDSITFTNWFVGTADQDYTTLQVVEIASANFNSGGTDGLRNKALEDFNFSALVAAFTAAGSPTNWALSNDMPSAQLASSATTAYGGDLAYYFGLNGNLTGVNLSAAQSTLTNSSFGTAMQTIDAFSGISGGGLQLAVATPPQRLITSVHQPQILVGETLGNTISPQRGIQLRPSSASTSTNLETGSAGFNPSTSLLESPLHLPSNGLSSTAIDTASTAPNPPVSQVSSGPAATPSPASWQAELNTEGIEPMLRLPDPAALRGGFGSDTDSQLDTARVIANGKLPQVLLGVSPGVSTIQIPAMSQALNVAPTSDLNHTSVANQVSPAPAIMATGISSAIEPRISAGDDFLRAIQPRISLPVRMTAAPATSGIEAPAMSTAMGLASSTEAQGVAEALSAPNISALPGRATLSQGDGMQHLIAPGRLPQWLDYALPANTDSRIATIRPTFAAPHIAGPITPVTIADVNSTSGHSVERPTVNPPMSIDGSRGFLSLVDPINVAWLTMHDALDQSGAIAVGGSEVADPAASANNALVAGTPNERMHQLPDELEMHTQQMRRRAM